jgi:2-C-methyl-D-erythritol 2,4-cyclodiphosphate synthase
MRIGLGYDIHAFSDDPERPLVLAGVKFDERPGLRGHSDADVVLHAICDALLGAYALGDIGDHFPPDDERWLDADSRDLLVRVLRLIPADARLMNVDVTIIAERPKIAPKRLEMRESVATLLGGSVDRVSVKATTNEGLGALGRGEGIAAIATLLIGAEE